MKAYIGYDRSGGSVEGACLIFAPDGKRARVLAWDILQSWFDTEWIDAAVKLLRDLPEHLKALNDGTERTIESPPTCPQCNLWGGHLIEAGCDLCMEDS